MCKITLGDWFPWRHPLFLFFFFFSCMWLGPCLQLQFPENANYKVSNIAKYASQVLTGRKALCRTQGLNSDLYNIQRDCHSSPNPNKLGQKIMCSKITAAVWSGSKTLKLISSFEKKPISNSILSGWILQSDLHYAISDLQLYTNFAFFIKLSIH